MFRTYYLFLLVILIGAMDLKLNAQSKQIDSLKLALKNAKADTSKIKLRVLIGETEPIFRSAYWDSVITDCEKFGNRSSFEKVIFKKYLATSLNNLAYIYYDQRYFSKALTVYNKVLAIDKEFDNKAEIAQTISNIANIYNNQNDVDKAYEFYSKSLNIYEEINDLHGISSALHSLSGIYSNKGNIPLAIEYLGRSLRILEKIGDKVGISASLNNMAIIYQSSGEVTKALEYLSKSLKMQEAFGDKLGIAATLNNIGTIYSSNKDLKKALECYYKSLKITEGTVYKKETAYSMINIGIVLQIQGNVDTALQYYNRCMIIQKEINDLEGLTHSFCCLASAHSQLALNEGTNASKKKNYAIALDYYNKGMEISAQLGFPINIRDAAKGLHETYKAIGDFRSSLKNYELYIQMRDSINSESTRKASIKSQLKYEYEKQAAADSVAHAKENEIKSAELSRQSAEIKAKKNQQYALFGGLGLVLIFAGFMYNRFKITQKQKVVIEHQKEIVEEQKKLVEEKQLELLDSIKYASRIQMAQIPSEKRVRSMIDKMNLK